MTITRLACFSLFFLCIPPALPGQAATAASSQTAPSEPPSPTAPAALDSLSGPAKSLYLKALNAHWATTADGEDFATILRITQPAVAPDGSLTLPLAQAMPLGSSLVLAYRVTQKPIFYKAAHHLRTSLQTQQNNDDIEWAPFLASFGAAFQDRTALDQAASALVARDTAGRDLDTGLLNGGGKLGTPENFALNIAFITTSVDALEFIPLGHPQRGEVIEALNKSVAAIQAQERSRKLWESLPAETRPALSLYTYAIARGVRLHYLPQSDIAFAQQAGALAQQNGIQPTSAAAVLARSEMDQSTSQTLAQGKTVMVDAWFNSQHRKNAAGFNELYHYKWNDASDAGFSFFGAAFERFGAELDQLSSVPTAAKLSAAQVYLIVSPDVPAKNSAPHFMDKASGDAIETWVKNGGVLVLMMNDGANTEFTHLNTLSERFGMHFNPVDKRTVQDSDYDQGMVRIAADQAIFTHPHQAFMKDICTITVSGPANAVLKDGEDVFMAVATVGRGTVFAVTDPWLYNEYADGRKLPRAFDNFAAGIDLAHWILAQTP